MKELWAIGPTLITDDAGNRQRVTSELTNCLNFHFPNSRGERRRRDTKCGEAGAGNKLQRDRADRRRPRALRSVGIRCCGRAKAVIASVLPMAGAMRENSTNTKVLQLN